MYTEAGTDRALPAFLDTARLIALYPWLRPQMWLPHNRGATGMAYRGLQRGFRETLRNERLKQLPTFRDTAEGRI